MRWFLKSLNIVGRLSLGQRRTDTPYVSPYKCKKHNAWMKKGECPVCYLEQQAQIKEYEKTGGSNKPPVKIGTTDDLGKTNN